MQDDSYDVKIDRTLEDLIPRYFENRLAEVQKLRELLKEKSFAEMARTGHRMKGVGASYGFGLISTLGMRIEKAAAAADEASLISCVSAYADYLSRVKVSYT